MNESTRARPFGSLRAVLLSLITGALSTAVAGCVPDDTAPDVWDPALGDGLFRPAGDQWNDCSTWDCNKNNPVLNTFPVDELSEDEVTPNAKGLFIEDVLHGGSRNIDVVDGEILIHDDAGVLLAGGSAVVGSSILVASTGGRAWEIMIADAAKVLQYWDGGGELWAYHLVYRPTIPMVQTWVDLCNDPPPYGKAPDMPDGYETYALLIDDERYDREHIKVDEASPSAGWFNIACAGSALSKMVLLHFDPRIPAGEDRATTPAQRTATLKMITADYTGTGRAFTEPGIALTWNDSNDWHAVDPTLDGDELEAVWTETGARCLNTPRVPSTEQAILDHLAHLDTSLPQCDQTDLTGWSDGDVWRTYNAP